MKICKKCLQEKEENLFYSHPKTADRLLPKCKECVKSGRKTEHERSLARIQEKKRGQDPKRKEQKRKVLKHFREENPEKWKAEYSVSNFLRYHKEFRPTISSVS